MKQILFFLSRYFSKPKDTSRSLSYNNILDVEFVRNYDGDTITVNIPSLHPLIGSKISIRLRGIDTPELRSKCAQEKQLAKECKKIVYDLLCEARRIDLYNVQRGKYFRIVADVVADGQNISKILLDKGIAVVYNGGTKVKDWCDND
jgi:endonuclease YncB( thermonuclease family)